MTYAPVYERFEAAGPDGRRHAVSFQKAGVLTAGDQPELYFFDLDGAGVVVGVSGEGLREFQRRRRSLSREEKIDLAGLVLKRQIEAGKPLARESLYIEGAALEGLVAELGLDARMR